MERKAWVYCDMAISAILKYFSFSNKRVININDLQELRSVVEENFQRDIALDVRWRVKKKLDALGINYTPQVAKALEGVYEARLERWIREISGGKPSKELLSGIRFDPEVSPESMEKIVKAWLKSRKKPRPPNEPPGGKRPRRL